MVEVFPEWRGKSLDGVLTECAILAEDFTYPTVRRWREAGGTVVGHFQVYFPEELAHAAGALPVKVRGAAIEPTAAASRFGSYLCSILKTSLDVALSGHLELDLFVTHPICDAARNLGAIWARNLPYPAEILYLPQHASSPHAEGYLRGEYERLSGVIEAATGGRIGASSLAEAIRVFDRNRFLLRELYRLKRTQPWKVNAEEAYVLVALAGVLPREEHNGLLEWVLPELERRRRRRQDKMRVVVEGAFCEQPPLDLVRSIGRSCDVVDDDFLIGLRWILDDIGPTADPLGALARAYLEASSYSPVQHDARKPKERMLLERVEHAGAEAVILLAAKMCEPGLEEQVTYTQALDREGVPYFVSELEENMSSFDHLEIQLETFVENLLFR